MNCDTPVRFRFPPSPRRFPAPQSNEGGSAVKAGFAFSSFNSFNHLTQLTLPFLSAFRFFSPLGTQPGTAPYSPFNSFNDLTHLTHRLFPLSAFSLSLCAMTSP